MRWSSRDWYASDRRFEGLDVAVPCSAAQDLSLLEATGDTDSVGVLVGGRRKGRAPLGEAWLFDAMVRYSMPQNLR